MIQSSLRLYSTTAARRRLPVRNMSTVTHPSLTPVATEGMSHKRTYPKSHPRLSSRTVRNRSLLPGDQSRRPRLRLWLHPTHPLDRTNRRRWHRPTN